MGGVPIFSREAHAFPAIHPAKSNIPAYLRTYARRRNNNEPFHGPRKAPKSRLFRRESVAVYFKIACSEYLLCFISSALSHARTRVYRLLHVTKSGYAIGQDQEVTLDF